jgi:hypothetical protein
LCMATVCEQQSRKAFLVYQKNAAIRRKSWALTYEQFIHLSEQRCAYCGSEPLSGGSNVWPHNGIDRRDNNQGYYEANCLPCCSICNHGKGTRTYARFVAYIIRVARNRSTLTDLDYHLVDAKKETIAEFERRT